MRGSKQVMREREKERRNTSLVEEMCVYCLRRISLPWDLCGGLGEGEGVSTMPSS